MALSAEQLAALRCDYSLAPLRRADLDGDPVVQFNRWLEQAHVAEVIEPNAMVLSTVDGEGQPWSRTVLLKVCDERGFTFFTNYGSAKGRQMGGNARVALTFWWGALERQVNVTGTVEKTSVEESAAYFQTRPRKSQLGAWASAQSAVVAGRDVLERQFAEAEERFGEGAVPLPEHWGGFRVRAQTVEFWQGRRSRLHDRLRYVRTAEGWEVGRLSP